MFVSAPAREQTDEDRLYAIKPMNCPGHIQIFKHGLKSYRDLPLRMAEFGVVHRYEPSGALHGLLRVRAFTQDDAHVFCTEAQMAEECLKINDLILSTYADFGFEEVVVKLSTRPEKRVGSDEAWDEAEAIMTRVLSDIEAGSGGRIKTGINPGEGAFYGPKFEYTLRDAIGREWQCGTTQVDFNLPSRFGAYYIGPDSEKKTPVMIHRAIFGSLERFTGILIEHFAGHLPLWLSPLQIVVCTITQDADDYAYEVAAAARKLGLVGRGRRAQREDHLQGARTFAGEGSRAARRRQERGGRAHDLDAPARLAGADAAFARGGVEAACGGSDAAGYAGLVLSQGADAGSAIPLPLGEGGPAEPGRVRGLIPYTSGAFPSSVALRAPPSPHGRRDARLFQRRTRGAAKTKAPPQGDGAKCQNRRRSFKRSRPPASSRFRA